jgi:hypothetical protein
VLEKFAAFLDVHAQILDELVHRQLHADIVEHLWMHRGNVA